MEDNKPLADQLRPNSLKNFYGQEHLVGKDKPIRRMLETNTVHSLIFWGPPGCGKTTLSRIIAEEIEAEFHHLSAVSAGKKELREICEQDAIKAKYGISEQLFDASEKGNKKKRKVVFLDEIHRFNKAQQDYLLPFVENGTIILIGATTENPSFEVNSALLSRCRVYVLNRLETKELAKLINQVSKHQNLQFEKKAKDFLIEYANGDARNLINSLQLIKELLNQRNHRSKISVQLIKELLQNKAFLYDKSAGEHYNTISAFIKSMRASNIDGALYYLARMVEAGEDPKFIARRMVVFASEDIGLAQPTAIVIANEVFKAVETIGYPEAQINLAHGVAYLCQCKKDRSAYNAYFAAVADVKKYGNLPIPMKLRNAPTKLMKQLDYGKNYQMYGDADLLPSKLKGKKYF